MTVWAVVDAGYGCAARFWMIAASRLMRARRVVLASVAVGFAVGGIPLARSGTPSPRLAKGAAAPADSVPVILGTPGPTRTTMRRVDFHLAEGVLLHISELAGEMRSLKQGVVDFDDKMSYVLTVDSGTVALNAADLTNLMNRHVFAYPGAPLRRLKVSMRGTSLGLTGTMHKGVDIPFDITSTVTLTPDQKMRLHPTKIRIFGVNGAVLMRALGINLQRILDLSKAKGVAVQGNDLVLTPLQLLPPPEIRGRIVAVRVVGNGLEQIFGPSTDSVRALLAPPPLPDSAARNYMLYRNGTLHFGKLYMTPAELLVVDEDASDPFDFDNDHYQRQLIAGHSRTLPSLGLEVYMPDAGKLQRAPATVSVR